MQLLKKKSASTDEESVPKRFRRPLKKGPLLLAAAVLLLVAFNLLKGEKSTAATLALADTSVLSREDMQSTISATGTVESASSMLVYSTAAYTVQEVPVEVGDYVEADGVSGTISALTLSYTTFTTPDNKEIFVPNSQLSAVKIINYNALGKRRLDLKFTASYDAPTQRVRGAILEAAATLPQILDDPAPVVYVSEYQSSSIEYLLRLWTLSEDYWDVYYALLEEVRESFARWEVEMTYDHLNVHVVER